MSEVVRSDSGLNGLWPSIILCDDIASASFRVANHDEIVPHPSMEANGMTTMRLQRLHLSSSPSPRTLAIS